MEALREFVRRLDFHSELNETAKESLSAIRGRPQRLDREEELRSPFGSKNDACLVASGLIGSTSITKEGKRQIIAVFIPGEICNIGAIIAKESSTTLVALEMSDVVWIRNSTLVELTQDSVPITKAFWRESELQAAVLKEWVINLGRRFARERVAHLFCEMACRYAYAGQMVEPEFVFPVTQRQLADIVGLTPVRVNNVISGLRENRVADFQRKKVRIFDWVALTRKGDFAPSYLPLRSRELAAQAGIHSAAN